MAYTPENAPLLALFRNLLDEHGPQAWWPGDSLFEIMVGAVLTQNTAWTNVEKAIDALRACGCLDPEAMLAVEPSALAAMIRPAGYFNVKGARLRNLCRAVGGAGGLDVLRGWPTDRLRDFLLAVNGVGPETADDILLYGFERSVFVIDAYTRRLLSRLGLARGDEPYDELRRGLEAALGPDAALYNEFHALIVVHGKLRCRPRPRCNGCRLGDDCGYAGDAAEGAEGEGRAGPPRART